MTSKLGVSPHIDYLPWAYLVCNRAGLALHANPSADRALGRRVRAGMESLA